MHLSPLAALLAWIPAGIYIFRRYSPRTAILINFLGGWAILPGARYAPSPDDFAYWVLGVCLPTTYLITKATVTGIAALGGSLLFCRKDWSAFRPELCDLPMLLWCCVPLLSAATHWNTLSEGIFGTIYQTLAWGVPWVLGRIYFSDNDSLLLFAKACVIAGICYLPICVLEFFTGPQLYALVYGYEPYRLVGAERYFGFRPIGFLEDGNQLGIWMAGAALLASSLAFHRLARTILGLQTRWVALALAGATLLCQSVGSILLFICLLPFNLLKRRAGARAAIVVVVLALMLCAAFLAVEHASLRSIAQNNRLVRTFVYTLERFGRHSLAWRLARDESHLAVALRKPLLGYGQWDWWRSGDTRPWSLWLLIFGMYGVVGLAAFGAILVVPVLRTVWPARTDQDSTGFHIRLALSGLILMVAFDNLLNGAMILPYLLAIAGMSSAKISRAIRPEPPGRRTPLHATTPPLTADRRSRSARTYVDESSPEHRPRWS